MKKGQKKRIWTREQKSEIVHKHLNEHASKLNAIVTGLIEDAAEKDK